MPAHVSAADAPEDLWRCHECGWTYPNHHPSAKHRRNHKKQCGKLPGFVKTSELPSLRPRGATGSSDECSSDEEHHRGHHLSSNQAHEKNSGKNGHLQENALEQSPTPAAATYSAQVSCNDSSNGSSPRPSDDCGARDAPTIHEETAPSTRNLDLPASKYVAGTPNGSDQGRSPGRSSSRGSARALSGQWCCKHCGWAYSNPHPSAKNRRKHKKTCGLAAAHVGAGGSSDEASSDDGSESNERVDIQEPLKCDSNLSQGSLGAELTNGISAKNIDLSKDAEGQALADTAQEAPLESNSQVPCDATSMDRINGGHVQENANVDDAQVEMGGEERTGVTSEQAPGAPSSTDVPVPLIDGVNSSQSQVPVKIGNWTTSRKQKSAELDRIVPDQQPQHVPTEQVEDGKPHLPQLSQPILGRETVRESVNNQESGDLSSTLSQSPVTLRADSSRDSNGGPQLDMKNPKPTPKPKPATGAGVREDTESTFEERSAPESQSSEGLVRSRVQIFEKLAQTSPQYFRKSTSPTVNSASPRQPRTNAITDSKVIGDDLHETPKVFQKTISPRRLSSETRPAASKPDSPNELQNMFSHLRRRGNFVQSECNELIMERA